MHRALGFFRRGTEVVNFRQVVKDTDKKPVEEKSIKITKEKQKFERLHVSIPYLRKMFEYSKYKMHYIDNLLPPEGSTVYRCGDLVDLCLGPHIQNTGKIKALKVMKVHVTSNLRALRLSNVY